MSLTDRLSQVPKGRGHYCTVGILMSTMPLEHKTEERDVLLAAMEDPAWPGTAIAQAIAAEGYTIDRRHVQQHRRGECTSANCPMPDIGIVRR
jgi:hypothetical protein